MTARTMYLVAHVVCDIPVAVTPLYTLRAQAVAALAAARERHGPACAVYAARVRRLARQPVPAPAGERPWPWIRLD